ncbi:MAG: DUF3127 domain-containing protein [Muribaculaceae bacterium]|nr:DUF3127 domain-containing protein [Muribaculaceae bacterium]
MEIKGTIIHALPEVSGVSKSGNAWKKREYVLENTEGNFPRKVAFTCFGENADRIQLKPGDKVTVYFDIESREFNGRWYTDIRAWRADVEAAGAPAAAAPAAAPSAIPAPPAADEEFPF